MVPSQAKEPSLLHAKKASVGKFLCLVCREVTVVAVASAARALFMIMSKREKSLLLRLWGASLLSAVALAVEMLVIVFRQQQ